VTEVRQQQKQTNQIRPKGRGFNPEILMKEMIERLKNIWTAFGGLSVEEQVFLLKNAGHVLEEMKRLGLQDIGACCVDSPCAVYRIYRLRPDFQLPEPEPVKEPRFVEYDIGQDGLFYACSVGHLQEGGESVLFNLSDLPSIVGFTGDVLFRYADGSEQWRYTLTDRNRDGTPAKPIKARFCITKGEK